MKENKGITLVALIITIIVMMILVAVSVAVILKSDLLGTAKGAGTRYKDNMNAEQNMGTGQIKVGDKTMKDYLASINGGNGGQGGNSGGETPDDEIEEDVLFAYLDGIMWVYKENNDGTLTIIGIDVDESEYVENYSAWISYSGIEHWREDPALALEDNCLNIPSKIKDKTVTKVLWEGSASWDYDIRDSYYPDDYYQTAYGTCEVETINLPDTVIEYGRTGNFANGGALGEISYGDFPSLKNFNYENNMLKLTGDCIFAGTKIESFIFPEATTIVPSRIFSGSSLKNITLHSGVKELAGCAFMYAHEVEEINLPNGLEKIGYCAFWSSGIRVNVPNTVTIIEQQVPSSDYGFYGEFNFPEGVNEALLVDGKVPWGAWGIERLYIQGELIWKASPWG